MYSCSKFDCLSNWTKLSVHTVQRKWISLVLKSWKGNQSRSEWTQSFRPNSNFKGLVGWLAIGISLIVTRATWDYRWNALLLGVLLRDRIYTTFRENQGYLRKARSATATGNWTCHLTSISFQCRTDQPMVRLSFKGKHISKSIAKGKFEKRNNITHKMYVWKKPFMYICICVCFYT